MNILKRIKHKTWEAMKKRWKRIKNRAKRNEISIIASMIKEIKYIPLRIIIRLQNIVKKIMKWWSKFNFHWKFWISWLILFGITSCVVYFFLWDWVSNFYGLSNKPIQGEEPHSQIVRNLGWLLWMAISFFGLSIGLDLAIWGRQIQHKSHLQERYEKAASMLGNEVMPVRVAGCRALMSLGTEDKSMKKQCVRLLFAFINDPYLKPEHQGKNLNRVFPNNESLRIDIQEASDSFSAIYNHYGKKGIDKERVHLPTYFWENKDKGEVSLIKANLQDEKMQDASLLQANLQGADLSFAKLQRADLNRAELQRADLSFAKLQYADLRSANLQKAKLLDTELQYADLTFAKLQYADLSRAKLQKIDFVRTNLQGANLTMADITDTRMIVKNVSKNGIISVRNLTKKQVLSAVWGLDEEGNGNPPSLPDEIENDPAVQEWLKSPHYNKKEKEEKRQERLKNKS